MNTGARFNPVAGLPEGAFQQAVANLARACGWRVAHFRPVRAHLGVPQNVRACQEAVASTFGLKADEYRPVRES